MQTQKPKELADDLAYLKVLLEKIMELVEKGTLELKAADALKIIELRRKLLTEEKVSKKGTQEMLLERIGQGSRQPEKRENNEE